MGKTKLKSMAGLAACVLGLALMFGGCVVKQGMAGSEAGDISKESLARDARRLYDGAPPVIPHDQEDDCLFCHSLGSKGEGDEDVPIAPHVLSDGISKSTRCVQCHVYQVTEEVFVQNSYRGEPQLKRRGDRMYPGAPPRVPHTLQLRKDCLACHLGEAAREEIKTPHPERSRCLQCHVPVRSKVEFQRAESSQ